MGSFVCVLSGAMGLDPHVRLVVVDVASANAGLPVHRAQGRFPVHVPQEQSCVSYSSSPV